MTTLDNALLLSTFCRSSVFDMEFLQLLESMFLDKIHEATGETLVAVFLSHKAWAKDMIDQCLKKKS